MNGFIVVAFDAVERPIAAERFFLISTILTSVTALLFR